jgi:DNA-binding HxlR family transcriptional regulator
MFPVMLYFFVLLKNISYLFQMKKIIYQQDESVCACKVSLDLLGDRWSLIIVRDLFRNKNTFSQFLNESAEHISSNVLVDRLKKLIALGVLDFERNKTDKKIKEYYLTDRGIDLYNIIYELQLWTLNHVTFNESENTKIWKNAIKLESKETTIKNYTNTYRELRLAQFGF